jgi:uncharacterized protein (DUF1697 family)
MPKYVAFLRAINLGGHTVKMETLRRLFEEMGFSDVETFIASGNVIFEAPSTDPRDLELKIEETLLSSLGYDVATFIRSTGELAEIIQYAPFPDAGPETNGGASTLYIAFVARPPGEQALQKLLGLASDINQFHGHACEIYWLCRTRFSDSGFSGAQLEKTLGLPATIRNVSTVKKIVDKYT